MARQEQALSTHIDTDLSENVTAISWVYGGGDDSGLWSSQLRPLSNHSSPSQLELASSSSTPALLFSPYATSTESSLKSNSNYLLNGYVDNDDYDLLFKMWNDFNLSINDGSKHQLPSCDLIWLNESQSLPNFDIILAITCTLCLVSGLLFILCGYRYFKAALFLNGFLSGSVLIYIICDREQVLPILGNAAIGIAAGVLFGLITMLVQYVGLFMVGLLNGFVVGVAMVIGVFCASQTSPVWIAIVVPFGCGLLCALICLKWQTASFVLCSSIIGAALIVVSADYFIERFWLMRLLWKTLNRSADFKLNCWFQWVLVLFWPILVLIGVVVQWKITAVGQNHKLGFNFYAYRRYQDSSLSKRHSSLAAATQLDLTSQTNNNFKNNKGSQSHRGSLTVLTAANGSAAEKLPSSYTAKPFRHLYAARRVQGDVICQSYMESLQRLSRQPKEMTTLSSEQTHLTVLTLGSNQSNSQIL